MRLYGDCHLFAVWPELRVAGQLLCRALVGGGSQSESSTSSAFHSSVRAAPDSHRSTARCAYCAYLLTLAHTARCVAQACGRSVRIMRCIVQYAPSTILLVRVAQSTIPPHRHRTLRLLFSPLQLKQLSSESERQSRCIRTWMSARPYCLQASKEGLPVRITAGKRLWTSNAYCRAVDSHLYPSLKRKY